MNSVVRYRASSFKPHFWAQARNNNNNKKNHPKKLSSLIFFLYFRKNLSELEKLKKKGFYISGNGTF